MNDDEVCCVPNGDGFPKMFVFGAAEGAAVDPNPKPPRLKPPKEGAAPPVTTCSSSISSSSASAVRMGGTLNGWAGVFAAGNTNGEVDAEDDETPVRGGVVGAKFMPPIGDGEG